MKTMKKSISMFLLVIMFAGMLLGCSTGESKRLQKPEDFAQAKVGVMSGSVFNLLADEYYPEAEISYMNMANLILNLQQEKIDGVLMDKSYFEPLVWENKTLSYIELDMPATEYAVAFPKTASSEPLMAQLNAFIRTQTENGWLAAQEKKWFSGSEPDGSLDMAQLTGENGTLRVAATVECKPFDYLKDGQYCGFDADFIFQFAKEYGYALEVDLIAFDALLPSLAAERYDLAISGITVTEERKESAFFSDPYYKSPIIMAVLGEDIATQPTLADLQDGTIAIINGTIWEPIIKECCSDAEVKFYATPADMLLALEQEKIDAFVIDETMYVSMCWENAPVTALDETMAELFNALVLSKDSHNEVLLEQLNTFITQSKSDGTIDALVEKWFSDAEPTEHPNYQALSGENGILKVAVENAQKPISYRKNNVFTGYEVEFLTMFADAYGYGLEFEGMSFEALIPAVESGKVDIGASGITITEERAQSVTFTESHMHTFGLVIVKDHSAAKADAAAQVGRMDELKEDFEKTFIREDRWKMIVEGIGVTMLISICSAIAGTLLGFGLYMLSRAEAKPVQKAAKAVAKVYSRIVAGTPVVVILMILFYVVFGNFRDISGILVAIIGFTLTFGAFVYDHMTVSVGSIDRGQTEAAYALGYTKNQTFFRIIFPQAMTIFMPSYCGQAVELIKATAVVGYIAVNDLTKMGDIIRSNTYEAFFPLIATAVIYFILTWIAALLLNRVKHKFEPKRRSAEEILKGVKTI